MSLDEKLEGVKLAEKIKQIDNENKDIARRGIINLLGNMTFYFGLGVYSGITNLNVFGVENLKGLLLVSSVTSTPFSYLTTVALHNEDRIKRLAGLEEPAKSPLLRILEKAKSYVGTSVASEATGVMADATSFYAGYYVVKGLTKLLNR